MSLNRYKVGSDIPQPIRKIEPALTDFFHTLNLGERLDNLAQKYYGDPMLAWIIMCGNPSYSNEFEISFGTTIRIPYPLERVTSTFNLNGI